MISGQPPGPLDRHAARLANEVEGCLLLRTERDRAEREAETLCSRLP